MKAYQSGKTREVMREIRKIINDGGDPSEFAQKSWSNYVWLTTYRLRWILAGSYFLTYSASLDTFKKLEIAVDPDVDLNYGDGLDRLGLV